MHWKMGAMQNFVKHTRLYKWELNAWYVHARNGYAKTGCNHCWELYWWNIRIKGEDWVMSNRKKGSWGISKRKDGRWEGRVVVDVVWRLDWLLVQDIFKTEASPVKIKRIWKYDLQAYYSVICCRAINLFYIYVICIGVLFCEGN